MTGEQKVQMAASICAAIAIVAFIGGCTVNMHHDTDTQQMKICLAAGMEWRGGDCVRPEGRP